MYRCEHGYQEPHDQDCGACHPERLAEARERIVALETEVEEMRALADAVDAEVSEIAPSKLHHSRAFWRHYEPPDDLVELVDAYRKARG